MLYVAGNLPTAIGEVYGDAPHEAQVCPNTRVALIRPIAPLVLLDLRGQGAAMRIGALPSLATGHQPRSRTQEWARAIYEDQPVAGRTVHGVHYDAAHTGGPALALWNTDSDVQVVVSADGTRQDFALVDPGMWSRVTVAADAIRVNPRLVGSCPRCG